MSTEPEWAVTWLYSTLVRHQLGLRPLQVERLSGLIEMPVERMCTDDTGAQGVRSSAAIVPVAVDIIVKSSRPSMYVNINLKSHVYASVRQEWLGQ